MVANSRQEFFHEESLILPTQLVDIWHRRAALPPERELLLAVLIQAMDDLRTFRFARTRRGRRVYVDTYAWVASDDRTWPYAFGNICDILNFSAECLRGELLRDGTPQLAAQRSIKATARVLPEPDESSSRDTR